MVQTAQLNGQTLAYMGDAVYETYIRKHLILRGSTKTDRLHKAAVAFVSAKAQAAILRKLTQELTDEEKAVTRRGKNVKPGTVPRHTPPDVYRLSTAFECLIGYVYLEKRFERLEFLLHRAWDIVEASYFDGS